ncbi:MAG: hypothetical protein NVS2B7_32090 [Herpetosiphon sp.]
MLEGAGMNEQENKRRLRRAKPGVGRRVAFAILAAMEGDVLGQAREAGQALQRRRWTLATAESCTGGLVGALVTAVAGSSAYYLGGIIAYSNDVKMQQLGVPVEIIVRDGAVSEACARAMAEGVRTRLGTDLGVATTGVAGPGGGTADKPVGLVFVALAGPGWTRCVRYHWQGDRGSNQRRAARAALEMVIEAGAA